MRLTQHSHAPHHVLLNGIAVGDRCLEADDEIGYVVLLDILHVQPTVPEWVPGTSPAVSKQRNWFASKGGYQLIDHNGNLATIFRRGKVEIVPITDAAPTQVVTA